jgi:hypothetical protein
MTAFSHFVFFSFSSAVKSGVGMLLCGVGSWETERCVCWGVGGRWLVFVMLGGVLGVRSAACLWPLCG